MKTFFKIYFILSIVLLTANCSSVKQFENIPTHQDTLRLHYNIEDNDYLSVGLWGIPMPLDYDKDGKKDLLVSCPDTPYKGLYFFRNIGTKSEPIFDKAIRINLKGYNNIRYSECKDSVFVFAKDVLYKNFSDSLFSDKIQIKYSGEILGANYKKSRSNMWSAVDWEQDGDVDIVVGIDTWDDYGWDNAYDEKGNWMNGPLHGYVYLLENINGEYINRGKIMAGEEIIDVYGAPNPCVADFDGDGDNDIICGEFVDGLTWFENIGTATEPKFAKGKQIVNQSGDIRFHVEMIVPIASDFDDNGTIDLIVGDEDGRIAFVRNTGEVSSDGMPIFKSPEYLKQKADAVKFGALSTPFLIDWDKDGLIDLLSGNSAGELAFIKNLGNNKWALPVLFTVNGEVFRTIAGENGSIQGPAERKWGYTVLTAADWDNDGFDDIIINSISGKVQWLRNPGVVGSIDLESPRDVLVAWEKETPKPEWNWWSPEQGTLTTQWRTTPYVIDWNNDGLQDLITLDYEGYLSYFERFKDENNNLLLKPGVRIFNCVNCSVFDNKKGAIVKEPGLLRLNQGFAGKSGRRKICFVDYDKDGALDLLVDSKNVALFRNVKSDGEQIWFEYQGDISEAKLAGHSTCPTAGDINGDGLTEIILGAEDGHFYLFNVK
jgi:FG-GAP repeat.